MLSRNDLLALADKYSTSKKGNMYQICKALNDAGIKVDGDGNNLNCENYNKESKKSTKKIIVKSDDPNDISTMKKAELVILAKKYLIKNAQSMAVQKLREAIKRFIDDPSLLNRDEDDEDDFDEDEDDEDDEDEDEEDEEDEDDDDDDDDDEDEDDEIEEDDDFDDEDEDDEEEEEDDDDDFEEEEEESENEFESYDLENYRVIKLIRILDDPNSQSQLQIDKLRNLHEKIGKFLEKLL